MGSRSPLSTRLGTSVHTVLPPSQLRTSSGETPSWYQEFSPKHHAASLASGPVVSRTGRRPVVGLDTDGQGVADDRLDQTGNAAVLRVYVVHG